jgi:hypothetical protein
LPVSTRLLTHTSWKGVLRMDQGLNLKFYCGPPLKLVAAHMQSILGFFYVLCRWRPSWTRISSKRGRPFHLHFELFRSICNEELVIEP